MRHLHRMMKSISSSGSVRMAWSRYSMATSAEPDLISYAPWASSDMSGIMRQSSSFRHITGTDSRLYLHTLHKIHTIMTIYKLSNTYCLHNIYTPFSREPHNIYTTYPHYLHTIYTLSTHLVEVGEVVVLVQHLLCRSLGPGHRQRWWAGQHYHVLTSLGSFLT